MRCAYMCDSDIPNLISLCFPFEAGANIHVPDAPRYPVLQASMFGRAEILELLLRSGCDVNTKNELHETGLHLLAQQNSERSVNTARILLEHDCDPNVLDNAGLAPLHKASPEMTALLVGFDRVNCDLESEAGDTPLTTAAKDRREGSLCALVKSGSPSLDKTDRIGMTPLMICAEAGNTGRVRDPVQWLRNCGCCRGMVVKKTALCIVKTLSIWYKTDLS